MTPEEIREIVRQELQKLFFSEKQVFHTQVQMLDGRNIAVGTSTGTKFGTEITQKIAFYGVTPVIQASAIAAPSGGGSGVTDAIDISARSRINAIITALKNFGITA